MCTPIFLYRNEPKSDNLGRMSLGYNKRTRSFYQNQSIFFADYTYARTLLWKDPIGSIILTIILGGGRWQNQIIPFTRYNFANVGHSRFLFIYLRLIFTNIIGTIFTTNECEKYLSNNEYRVSNSQPLDHESCLSYPLG